ncbi:hypothetical protein [Streptomyces uncialis]|uniref:Uncharacterized protein n=1 Tax=Streptomyces uncialis TaxID=1048205 RepID=A0A1Q4V9Q2_9ACTN|nr:hypothetical protein [Streptomyces uncialis]MCX4658249.1 hypothetical protein [Streptomyces uncialis]OKH94564.1 hypothetical protein AB852_09895 [Streptomyces uncialis]WST66535.1 hypothetical protein OG268_02795 [Streptomyces uncialis]WTE14836.1 hypothetical protein OG924_34140 [Streptomyces uncialis]
MNLRHATLAATAGALMMCGAATAQAAAASVTTDSNDQGRSVDLRKETAHLTHDMDRKATTPVHMAGYLLSAARPRG